MGIAAVWELLKNSNGIQFVQASTQRFFAFGRSAIDILQERFEYIGGMLVATPAASPMLMGVGFIVGSAVTAVFAVIGFVGYITKFQILPEERLLANLFGSEYSQYCHQVRRWV